MNLKETDLCPAAWGTRRRALWVHWRLPSAGAPDLTDMLEAAAALLGRRLGQLPYIDRNAVLERLCSIIIGRDSA
jgi:hypothetical protein